MSMDSEIVHDTGDDSIVACADRRAYCFDN